MAKRLMAKEKHLNEVRKMQRLAMDSELYSANLLFGLPKVGDILTVCHRFYGHRFPLGAIVKVIRTDNDINDMFLCEDVTTGDHWWVKTDEVIPAIFN